MDELMIFALVIAGLHLVAGIAIMCVNIAREKKDRKNKEDNHDDDK